MSERKFYDIHFHTMDLSHPNMTAFIERIKGNKISFTSILQFVLNKIISIFSKNRKLSLKNTQNLLSYMESSIKCDFLILEHFLKIKEPSINENNKLIMGNTIYDKIVLCPLIMDFNNKNISNKDVFYNLPPQKPVVEQSNDLLGAISTYFNYELDQNNLSKVVILKSNKQKNERLFEIYPFMGINTENYNLKELKDLLNKYFTDFSRNDTKEERQQKLFSAMGEFKGDLEDEENCKNIFAGIKLYPPLGFQPWPDKSSEELSKVSELYKFCVTKNIPVTTHCSTGGFKIEKDALKYSDPGNQWKQVLEKYPELKINFAHFGKGNKKWQKTIIEYLQDDRKNVFTDFSCNTGTDFYYKKISKLINRDPELQDKILFGSDFMINLLWYKSYNDYINVFVNTSELSSNLKESFVNKNAEWFLFG
jgi:hypothetical protein